VTLNITILTETRIFQSSDFRLSSPDGPLDLPAMKLITLQYPGFNGLLSYTGIAKEHVSDPKDTADHLMLWLQKTEGMPLFQVVEHLRTSASTYIADIERRTRDRQRLTLIAAAFVGNNARWR
jgi:hypothetical protein